MTSRMTKCKFPLPLNTAGYPSLIPNRYIVDYSFMDFTDPDRPSSQVIDENSLSVTAFGIWPPSLIAERIPPRLHREIS